MLFKGNFFFLEQDYRAMAPQHRKGEEERLKKKREADKVRQAKIRSDPVLLAKEQSKRHALYLKRLEKKQVVPIKELGLRAQRHQQARWRKNSKHYRDRNKAFENHMRSNTPPSSPDEQVNNFNSNNPNPTTSAQTPLTGLPVRVGTRSCNLLSTPLMPKAEDLRKKSGRRKLRKDRAQAYRNLRVALNDAKRAKKRANKYKQKYYRLLNKDSEKKKCSTPRSKVRAMLKSHRFVSATIKKRLVYAEVLDQQMTTSYNTLQGKSKQVFSKMFFGGKILRKYRCLASAKSFLKYRALISHEESKTLLYQRKSIKDYDSIVRKVTQFLEKDENSRMCPGKRDTVTRNKVKKQKHLLSDTMLNLHKKFVQKTPAHSNVSYSRFCALRPFWIITPKANNRDTCACTIHANMHLLMTKLKTLNIVSFKSANELLKELCCESEHCDTACMLRKCPLCCDKIITYNEFNMNDTVSYSRWALKKESRTIRGKDVLVSFIAKTTIEATVGDMVSLLEETFPKYMCHVANIRNQHHEMDNLKKIMTEKEVIIHIDFSENYACKYSEEVQSVHFGASRQQVTMHTGVLYHKDIISLATVPLSFCTLSESMRHDPAAIWTHLLPIFTYIKDNFSSVNTIHFLSDSPSTQYRNKNNFYLLVKLLKIFYPCIIASTWNFSEAGHGKGAPDGIGATLKRTADRIVAQGTDVPNFITLVKVLAKNTKGVMMKVISENDIKDVDHYLEGVDLKPFKGTMTLHQVTWSESREEHLSMRTLSCFKCSPGKRCIHYSIGTGLWQILPTDVQVLSPSLPVPPILHLDQGTQYTHKLN
ncbi:MAG: hypothetical protein ACRC6C_01280, partial [Wolbachia pipientis]